MKRALSILLLLAMVFASAACSSGKKTSARLPLNTEVKPKADYAMTLEQDEPEEENEFLIPEDDPIYEETRQLQGCIAKICEYRSINNDEIDLSALNAVDFWDLIAIVVNESHDEGDADELGIYHIPKERVDDYARTFFAASIEAVGIPPYQDSYSVTKEPYGKDYDIAPISVENMKWSLQRIEHTHNGIGEYVIYLGLVKNSDPNGTVYTWAAYLQSWPDDGASHRFPYQVVKIQHSV